MQAEFENFEDKTGLKFPFNVFPRDKLEEKKCIVPLSCLYQPLRIKENPIYLESLPIACRNCKSILNPYCVVDPNTRTWSCSICNIRNQFPNEINNLPFETLPDSIDAEYILPPNPNIINSPLVFIYVVDITLENEDLIALKESLLVSINLLPSNSFIGFITFGKNVNLYEIGHQDFTSTYSFNGSKEYSKEEIDKKLGILNRNRNNNNSIHNNNSHINDSNDKKISSQRNVLTNRFIQQTAICEFNLTLIIESLTKDSFKIPKFHRAQRSTGCALNIASNLLNTLFPKTGCRIMLFTGGPCTYGPGNIVSTKLKDSIRSHHDLLNDSTTSKRFKSNKFFYNKLAEKAAFNGHTFDIFIGSYDQVGLHEMEVLFDKTGGIVVQSDSFTSAIFKQSLHRFLNSNEFKDFNFGLNATLELKVNNLKINGLIGHATKIPINNNNNQFIKKMTHEKNIIGIGNTNSWKLGSISTHSSYGIYFELIETKPVGTNVTLQFITTYQHPDGSKRIHVTTCQKPLNISNNNLIDYFDQEASAVLIARQAIFKVNNDTSIDAIRFCDKILIDLCSSFGNYRLKDPKSLVLPSTLNLFPQFMYHLRRSTFIQVFNSSPDETSFIRHCFLTEDSLNSLIMIQPTLTSYELDKEPEPVLLDSTSINPNRILLLDTYFHILIYHGSVIADWRRNGYQDQPDYKYFKDFLELPRQEAADILVDRFPLPRFIDTEEGGSQARFLMSKLNPTTSYRNSDSLETLARLGPQDGSTGAVILTDDVSLQTFMEYVYEAVVKPT